MSLLEEIKNLFDSMPEQDKKKFIDEIIRDNTIGPTVEEYDEAVEYWKNLIKK